MGKKKIDNLKFILDRNLRNITYHKRKRGLIKKVIEICSLCDLDVYMFMYDKDKKKIIEFMSDLNFNNNRVKDIKDNIRKPENKNKYQVTKITNKDYYEYILPSDKSDIMTGTI